MCGEGEEEGLYGEGEEVCMGGGRGIHQPNSLVKYLKLYLNMHARMPFKASYHPAAESS